MTFRSTGHLPAASRRVARTQHDPTPTLEQQMTDTTPAEPDLTTPDATLTSLLRHLPREARRLVAAVDALRDGWGGSNESERHDLWSRVDDASEAMNQPAPSALAKVLAEVAAERARQDERWGVQTISDFERISILTEEAGEAAKAANEANFVSSSTRGDFRNLREELIQVASVAVDHVQAIDRRMSAPVSDECAANAAATVPAPAPTDWIDGHQQLEAIAAAVWEKCGRSDSGSFVEDDPRNIAVAVLAAVLPPPADRATVLREAADALPEADLRLVPPMDRKRVANWLRRLADAASGPGGAAGETQQDGTQAAPGTCGHRSSEGHPCTQPSGHLGYHRNSRQHGNEWTSWVGDTPATNTDTEECCGAEPPEGWPGDCWCTLPPEHPGDHQCTPCSNRHDAPGWTEQPAAVAQPGKEA